jgi:predicted small lipoprotein YifL
VTAAWRAGRRRAASSLTTVALGALVALTGCGRKGPPVAPERRLPMAPSDLAATVGPGEIALGWRNPRTRVDRSRLRDLSVVRLYRVADSGQGDPKPAIRAGDEVVGYSEVAAIDLERPAPAVVERDHVRIVDREGLTDGRRYTYVVTASDSQGRTSAPSNRLSVVFVTAPRPPGRITGQAGDGAVELAWQAPTQLVDGRPLTGAIAYEVLRAESPDVAPSPVTPTPIVAAHHTDTDLQNEQTYHYAVRAIRSEAGGQVVSDRSDTVALTPRDVTPPSPPMNLVAIPSQGIVNLSWSANREPDLGAYIIYRESPRGQVTRVGRVAAPGTVFVDRGVPSGTFHYVITAVDTASQPNESRRSARVTVAVP